MLEETRAHSSLFTGVKGNYLRQFGTQGGEDGQSLYPSGEFTADAHGNTLVTDIYTIRLQRSSTHATAMEAVS